jgi:hypothetical protein
MALALFVIAHHMVLAIPFALPAITVTAGVAVLAWRERHREDDEDDASDGV